MFRSIFTVSGFTLLSRVLGFARDVLIAKYLGAGATADIWVAAFRFPNLFRRIFGEGAFNAAFVPMYSGRIEEKGEAEADSFARKTISLMFVILLVIFVLAFIFMEPIVRVTTVGFALDGRLEPGVAASRITVGYLIFICLVAALSGILNSRRVFGAPAFAYVVLNIVFLVALVFVIPKTGDPVRVLCWSVMVSGVLQLLVVFVAAIRRGVDLRPSVPKIDSDAKKLGKLMTPGLVSAGVQQINLLVGQTVVSLQLGGVALFYYADRINQLPLGLLGIALGTVLLPEITRRLRGGDESGAKKALVQGMEIALLFSLPAVAAMFVIPVPIIHALFVQGEFTAEAAKSAGFVLAAFATGTPSYVLAKVLQPAYFAREDTKTPMRYTIVSAVVNIVLAYPMFLWLGPAGCAFATSIAGWVNLFLLWNGLRLGNQLNVTTGFVTRTVRMIFASAIMGGLIWFLCGYARPWIMTEGNFAVRVAVLAVLVGIGVVIYFAAVIATRVYSVAELKSRLRRSPRT
ncbi:MAG: murein biosynthesis integral membrane protein MurJ [Verrucomicrobiales bacterium]|jgi:putative peptidoglycan lipid II flippase|nr:murein biosynthesis integral membrane protein MurJ [Verrucomicrobiales bacterium]